MDWPTVTWAAPGFAWLLVLAAPAALLCRHAIERRRRERLRLAGEGGEASARHWPACLALAAVFLLLVAALCRPQWGRVTVEQQILGADILIALDVSRSMLADDLAPTRLAAAKRAMADLLPRLRGERVGLIAFAGSAFLVCPLTSDYQTFAAVLAETGPDSLPLGGTELAGALAEARRAFGGVPERRRHLLVISDGEDHGGEAQEGDLDAAVRALRDAGVTVHGAVVGAPDGGLIPLPNGDFLRDRRGAIVKSRPRNDTLAALATAGGGHLLDLAADPNPLAGLHATALSATGPGQISRTRWLPAERYQWPLAVAVLLLLAGPFLGRGGR